MTTTEVLTSVPTDPQVTIRVVEWADPVVDAAGHDPRSAYVETFWLPVLGPSATFLLRRLASGLDAAPDGFDLVMDDTARALGLGGIGGRHSPFRRAIVRCARYGIVRHLGPDVLAVRRRIAPVPRRLAMRFPPALREHLDATEAQNRSASLADARREGRALALDLVAAADSPLDVEQVLHRWGVHPAISRECAQWAWARHTDAAGAVAAYSDGGPTPGSP
jgi:hypothetical protein